MSVLLKTQDEKDRFFKGLSNSDKVESSEQRVVKQFLEALLYERVVDFEIKPALKCQSVFEDIYSLQLTFMIERVEFRCIACLSSFDRVRIAQGSVEAFINSCWREPTIDEVMAPLKMEASCKADLLTELEQTIALCRWNTENLPQLNNIRRNLDFVELESAIHEGHLYHPCFKARRGFTVDDHLNFGPEAAQQFQFVWFAIRRQDYQSNLPLAEAEFWQQEIGDTYRYLIKALEHAGGAWTDYALMPVHPWQADSILTNEPQSFDSEGVIAAMARGEIINLGSAGDFYQASQSLRTVINVTNPKKANVKLPMNVMSTSSNRNLPEHFVITAPVLSQWLENIVGQDTYLQAQDKLVMLSEYAAVSYIPKAGLDNCQARADYVDEAEEGLLGAIFRTSVLSQLRENELAIPFTALMLLESDERLFVADWLDTYGIEAWLRQLFEVAVVPIWHLLVHHGIGFESHAQNLVLIHENGWPARIAMRDFHEDTEYLPEFLIEPDQQPNPGSVDPWFNECSIDEGFISEDVDDLRELFLDAICVFNLSELSFQLEKHYGFAESRFWQLFNAALDAYEQTGVTNPDKIAQVNVRCDQVNIESLLEKKIKQGLHTEWFDHSVKNGLAITASLKN